MGINISAFALDNLNITSQCMTNGAKKHRHFVFTWNNPPPTAQETLSSLAGVSYLVAGNEVGAGGTPHLQGALSFASPRTESSVHRLLPGVHVEVQRGTHSQAHSYCKKDGDFFEVGIPTLDKSAQATQQSEDWETAFESAKSGNLEDIPKSLRVRYYRTWGNIRRDYQVPPPALESVCGIWIYGPSGSGKSYTIFNQFPNSYIKDASKWWCGYQGEDTVWLDDIDPDQSKWLARFLKIWADRYPFQAQTKGGSLVIRPLRVVVTSNYSISQMGFNDGDVEPIRRRFRELVKPDRGTEININ